MSVFGAFLVPIFPHLDCRKIRTKKTQIRALFKECYAQIWKSQWRIFVETGNLQFMVESSTTNFHLLQLILHFYVYYSFFSVNRKSICGETCHTCKSFHKLTVFTGPDSFEKLCWWTCLIFVSWHKDCIVITALQFIKRNRKHRNIEQKE